MASEPLLPDQLPVAAAIALGGNLGDVPETFERAILALNESGALTVRRRSRNFLTRAVGTQAGGDYINAAVLLDARCGPLDLLDHLQQIEAKLGRVRTVRWGPRTLDLDILSFGEEVIHQPDPQRSLFVPHPACWYRRFALDPWEEVAPNWRHPVLKETVRELRQRLLPRPLPVRISGSSHNVATLRAEIQDSFPANQIRINGPETAVVEFRWREDDSTEPPAPRSIFLPGNAADPSSMEMARQVLQAMLDVPQP